MFAAFTFILLSLWTGGADLFLSAAFLATKKFELICGTCVLLCFLGGQAHWFTYNERMPIESNVNVWA